MRLAESRRFALPFRRVVLLGSPACYGMSVGRIVGFCAHERSAPAMRQTLLWDLWRCLGLVSFCTSVARSAGIRGWETHSGERRCAFGSGEGCDRRTHPVLYQ